LIRDAAYYPVVTLTGPRQSGKSTLGRTTFPSHQYLSLELINQRRFAEEDPRGFLAGLKGQVILDEIQHVPELLSYIQAAVDTARRWISVFNTSFIVFLLQPHHRIFNKRVIKSPKLYF